MAKITDKQRLEYCFMQSEFITHWNNLRYRLWKDKHLTMRDVIDAAMLQARKAGEK